MLKKNYTIEKRSDYRFYCEFDGENEKGEKIAFEFSKCEPELSKNSLPVLWEKAGYTDHVLKNYWSFSTYATDKKGLCRGIYNPQIEKGTHKIDFKWLLEATEENKEKIINEIFRLATE